MNRMLVFWLLTAAYFLSYFFRSTNAVIAPDLTRELALSASDLGLMTGVFYAAFALTQLPIGLALDRFGPRLVQPVLLLVAVTGSMVFFAAHSLPTLILARALLGVGLGGSLMAAFKAFGMWFPAAQNATATGALMGLGAFGAIAATSPLAWIAGVYGWRGVFVLGAALTLVCAASIAVWVRNAPPGTVWAKPAGMLNPFAALRDPRIQRICVLNFFVAGGLLSVQTLWAGPYVSAVYSLERQAVAGLLLVLSLGVASGYFLNGLLADRFGLERVAVVSIVVFVIVQALLVWRVPFGFVGVLYFLFGLTGTGNLLLISQARTMLPAAQSGLATTSVNMFGIGGAFLLQWLIGVIVDGVAKHGGQTVPEAFSWAFAVLALGTFVGLIAYLPVVRMAKPGPVISRL